MSTLQPEKQHRTHTTTGKSVTTYSVCACAFRLNRNPLSCMHTPLMQWHVHTHGYSDTPELNCLSDCIKPGSRSRSEHGYKQSTILSTIIVRSITTEWRMAQVRLSGGGSGLSAIAEQAWADGSGRMNFWVVKMEIRFTGKISLHGLCLQKHQCHTEGDHLCKGRIRVIPTS